VQPADQIAKELLLAVIQTRAPGDMDRLDQIATALARVYTILYREISSAIKEKDSLS
jgi:hypothetical protein